MEEAQFGKPAEAAETPSRFGRIRSEIRHIGDAFASARQAPVLAALIAISGFFMSKAMDEGWTWTYDRFKPASLKTPSELAADELSKTTMGISAGMEDVTAMLRKMSETGAVDEKALQDKVSGLVAQIASLQPQLSHVDSLRDDIALASLKLRDRQIADYGYSLEADIILRENLSAAICASQHSIGVRRSSSGFDAPSFTLRSPDGKQVSDVLEVGEGLSIETPDGPVSITYMSYERAGENNLYGVDFSCPTGAPT